MRIRKVHKNPQSVSTLHLLPGSLYFPKRREHISNHFSLKSALPHWRGERTSILMNTAFQPFLRSPLKDLITRRAQFQSPDCRFPLEKCESAAIASMSVQPQDSWDCHKTSSVWRLWSKRPKTKTFHMFSLQYCGTHGPSPSGRSPSLAGAPSTGSSVFSALL